MGKIQQEDASKPVLKDRSQMIQQGDVKQIVMQVPNSTRIPQPTDVFKLVLPDRTFITIHLRWRVNKDVLTIGLRMMVLENAFKYVQQHQRYSVTLILIDALKNVQLKDTNMLQMWKDLADHTVQHPIWAILTQTIQLGPVFQFVHKRRICTVTRIQTMPQSEHASKHVQ